MHDYSAQALDAPVQNPDGLQGFLTQSGRKICRQGGRGEMLNWLLNFPAVVFSQASRYKKPPPPMRPL